MEHPVTPRGQLGPSKLCVARDAWLRGPQREDLLGRCLCQLNVLPLRVVASLDLTP